MTQAQVVKDAAGFVILTDDRELIKDYFKSLMETNPYFSSVYFLSRDNELINGSGWVPPEELDLRERPWYISAIETGKLIFTEAFLNASRDKMIVTVAVPVKSGDGEILGVAAGDMAIEDIISLVPGPGDFDDSFSFMTDGNGNILAYPLVSYDPSAGLTALKDVSADLAGMLSSGVTGLYEIELDGEPGYVSYRAVDGTHWKVGSFVRIGGRLIPERELLPLYLAVLVPVLLMLAAVFFWQRLLIIKPIRGLERDILAVSPGTDPDHRIPEDPGDPFFLLRKTVNKVLDRTSESFVRIRSTNEMINEKNQELSAAMLQLRTIESELRRQYESLYLSRAELKVSEEMNRAIVSAIPDRIVRLDAKGRILDHRQNEGSSVGRLFAGVTGASSLKDLMPEEAALGAVKKISEVIRTGQPVSFDYCIASNDRTEYYEVRVVNIRKNEVIAIIRDVTEQRNNLKYIEFLSYHDQLSGLFNRRYFDEKLPLTDIPANLPISVMMLDLNALKMANDAFGHHFGDRLIREIAGIMRDNCREGDMLVRSGGDEFIAVMPNTDIKQAAGIMAGILAGAAASNTGGIQLSVSGGCSTKESADQDILDILLKAEVELYRNKLIESPAVKNKIIDDIVELICAKDSRNLLHFKKVSVISRKIGQAMHLTDNELDMISTAGFYHDIGKIAVIADNMLDEADFDDASTAGYRKHPETGYQILRSSDKVLAVAEYVLYHHERWDGSGFPRGIKGDEIPLISRIIAVADFYDSCIAESSRLPECSGSQALSRIAELSGTHFDPAVVAVMQSVFGDIQSDP